MPLGLRDADAYARFWALNVMNVDQSKEAPERVRVDACRFISINCASS